VIRGGHRLEIDAAELVVGVLVHRLSRGRVTSTEPVR
jgi:hypothetical protein